MHNVDDHSLLHGLLSRVRFRGKSASSWHRAATAALVAQGLATYGKLEGFDQVVDAMNMLEVTKVDA